MSHQNGGFSSPRPLDAVIAGFAADRHGVFSFAEVVRLGATERIVSRRCATGRWERLHLGVYRMSGVPRSWRQDVLAACLAAGEGAAASHHAAGCLWCLPGFEPIAIEISVPRGRRPRPNGVRVHQVDLPSADVTLVEAIPVTTPARTLLDLASVAPADTVEEALDDALRRRLVTVARLRWRLDELGPRRGVAIIRRFLNARSVPADGVQSVLETRLLRLIRRAGLPRPVAQHRVRDRGRLIAIVDFAYPEKRLAIEVDGYRWHSGRARWQRDLARRNALTRLGWRVIHFTAHDLDSNPEGTIAAIAEALSGWQDL